MLKCRDVPEEASALLDGGLSLRARLGLRLHLAMCSMCRTYVDQIRKTRALLGRGRPPPLDPAEEDELIARMTAGRGDGTD